MFSLGDLPTAQVQKELRDVEERAAQIGAATQDAMDEYQSLKAVRHSSIDM